MADSFRNESIGYYYEWAIESIDSLNSFKHVDLFSNQTQLCVARRHNSSAVALIGTSQYVLSLSHAHLGCSSLILHDINTLSIAVYTECH